jgi:hypothetical protein
MSYKEKLFNNQKEVVKWKKIRQQIRQILRPDTNSTRRFAAIYSRFLMG